MKDSCLTKWPTLFPNIQKQNNDSEDLNSPNRFCPVDQLPYLAFVKCAYWRIKGNLSQIGQLLIRQEFQEAIRFQAAN